jgi:hypothetical protein
MSLKETLYELADTWEDHSTTGLVELQKRTASIVLKKYEQLRTQGPSKKANRPWLAMEQIKKELGI